MAVIFHTETFTSVKTQSSGQRRVFQNQKMDEEPEPKELVNQPIEEEPRHQMISSLVLCYFAGGVYDRETIVRASKPLGIDMDEEDLRGFTKLKQLEEN